MIKTIVLYEPNFMIYNLVKRENVKINDNVHLPLSPLPKYSIIMSKIELDVQKRARDWCIVKEILCVPRRLM